MSSTFDVVLGELSFRDGIYSTDRQVGYDLQGKWETFLFIRKPGNANSLLLNTIGLYFYAQGFALLFANKDDEPAIKDIAATLPVNITAGDALHTLQNIRSFMNISSNGTKIVAVFFFFFFFLMSFSHFTRVSLCRGSVSSTHHCWRTSVPLHRLDCKAQARRTSSTTTLLHLSCSLI